MGWELARYLHVMLLSLLFSSSYSDSLWGNKRLVITPNHLEPHANIDHNRPLGRVLKRINMACMQ